MKHVFIPLTERGEPRALLPSSRLKLLFSLLAVLWAFTATAQNITTVAGNGTYGYSGDGGAAISARLYNPFNVATDAAGNLYIAEYLNHRVRKVAVDGTITTVAGMGVATYGGDGGAATSAQLRNPSGVAVDAAGNIYIADYGNDRIRKVAANGTITTVAGTGVEGYSGDGGQATSAKLIDPYDVAVDAAGNLYIADYGNSRVRRVAANGIITTVAGSGIPGYSGDGGAATSAKLTIPRGVAVDAAGNLYIADQSDNRIRKVSTNGIITTVAGNGTSGYSGDGGAATSAQIRYPTDVAVDAAGNLYIADQSNFRIRKVSTNGVITTVAGNGTSGYSGDGGAATGAQFSSAFGVCVDVAGSLYIADAYNQRIRKVEFDPLPVAGYRNGLQFDGVNDYVEIPSQASNQFNSETEFTVSLWFKANSMAEAGLFNRPSGGGDMQYWLTAGNGRFTYGIDKHGYGWTWVGTTDAYKVGEWVHVTAVRRNVSGQRKMEIYANGVLVGSGTVNYTSSASSAPIRIGTYMNVDGGFANGQIDNVSLWKKALTVAEIKSLGATTLNGNEAGLAGYWRFDETTGTIAYDATANVNHGTLKNMDLASARVVSTAGDITTNEDVAYTGKLAGSDESGNALTYAIVTAPTKGTLTLTDAATGAFTYTPTANINGTDVFTYKVNNGSSDSEIATVNVTIVAVNDAPIPSIATLPTVSGECNATVAVVPTANDDNDGVISATTTDPVTYTIQGTHTINWIYTDAAGSETIQQQTVIVKDTKKPGEPTFEAPSSLVNKVSEAAHYNLAYSLDLPNAADWDIPSQIPYAVNNAAALQGKKIVRIAYALELDNKWVWVSMDAFSQDVSNLGIPTGADGFQQKVSNMNVFSNETVGLTTGKAIATGNIELWSNCYGTTNSAGLAGANNSLYDFDDQKDNPNCHGSFQIHNYGAKQTIFGYNSWSNGAISELGIGTNPSGHPDWTFANTANSYTTKKLQIFIQTEDLVFAKDAVVYLDANGNASITAADVNAGVSDNCGIASVEASPTTFTAANLGANTVTFTATDVNGNIASTTANVTVIDNTNPVFTSTQQNVTLALDANIGTASVADYAALATATDNTGTVTIMQSPIAGTALVKNVATTVTLTATDVAGNIANQTFTVTATDQTAPVPTLANLPTITGECAATVTAPTATDNTAGTVTATTTDPLEYLEQGNYTITWTYNDGNGNTLTQTQQVIVKDETAPVFAAVTPITKNNDADKCGAIVTYTMPTATDNCSALPDPNAVYTLTNGGQLYDHVNKRMEPQNSPGLPITFAPTNGSKMAAFFVTGPTTARLSQNVTLPATGPVTLTFDLQYNNHNGSFDSNSQFMAVEVRNPDTDALLRTIFKTEPGAAASIPMTSYSFDISEFEGQNVKLVLTNTNIQLYWLDILLDNVKIAGSTLVNGSFETGDYTGWTITETGSGTWGIGSGKATPVTITQTAGLASGELFPLGTTTNTFVSTDAAGNTSTTSFDVTVTDTQKPTVVTQNITVNLDATGAATITAAQINNGSTDNCSIPATGYSVDKSIFTCDNVGPNTVTLTVTDVNGNTSSKEAIVTVKDVTAPIAKVKAITVQLDATGAATITPAMVDNGSSDICGTVTLALSKTTFDCTNLGANTITLTVTDAAGNETTTTATITVEDNVAPKAIAKNITVQLDATGNATIAIADVNYGSTDNCGIETFALSKTAFDCSNVGDNTVTLTVTDKSGNTHEATAIVTVVDNTLPIALAKNITVQLDATGNVTIVASDINNGSSDACGIKSMTLSRTTFDCANVGDNTVTLTVTDNNGNVSTATAIVKVEDKVIPVAKALNVTIELDANGVAAITAAAVDNGSTDACGAVTLALSKTTFGCANVGANTVTLTVTDKNGNIATVEATVTVVDNVVPVALAKNITVQLDATGNATITTDQVNNGSSDNCGIKTMSLDKTTFDCSQVGENVVTLTVTDVNNNTHTTTAIVTVEDKVAPVVITQNITVQLDATGNATITAEDVNNGSSDACRIKSISLDKTTFDCSSIGANTVTLTVTDNNGNVTTKTAIVTVEDKIAPIALAKNITIKLDATGKATIVAADVNNGSSDVCGSVTLTIDKAAFDCSNIGENEVMLTVTDAYGNVASEKAIVTIVDDLAPVVLTQNITVKLDAAGNATINTAQINNGSTDNCGIATIVLNVTQFTCENVGVNTVTLAVTDVNGNVATKEATVTIVDEIAPTAIAKNFTAALDANGTVTITAAQVNDNSTDNCGVETLALDTDTFGCSNLGENTVNLTVTDKAGNTAIVAAIVTIVDNIAPTITAPADLVLDVDAGKTTASNVNLGTPVTADNCDAAAIVITNDAPTEYPAGTTIVTWTATDASGNKTTATQTVTVRQDIASVATLATINVPIRTAYADVPLPTTVEVTYTNGQKEAIGVTWTQGTYNGLVAGTYVLTGQLIPAPNTTNRNSKVATISVVVEPNKAPTNLAFSATTFKPEAKAEDVIGTLTTTDADDTEFVYSLVTGEGDTGNSLFEIRGDKVYLKSNNGLSGKTTFSIRVRSTDPYQNTIEKVFTLNKEPYAKPVDKLKIVNAFSPNGDGMNDTWTIPELRFYNSVEIEVYDRAGVRLFHTTDPEKGWDGRGLNGEVLQGAFFYIVQVKDINLVKKGVVTIIKK
ncbi:LamG-like jellyroll fold domain-containing protein [Pontibacter vulgaris]|uniref:NHL domain-containing protein n=1 Tax=Pontibacter vulgaris TaxID=2905679 RepID=UPI001FA791D8|nr:LamG-like jellyroll fold domain-containing protein [Pontibacter vulgaris]